MRVVAIAILTTLPLAAPSTPPASCRVSTAAACTAAGPHQILPAAPIGLDLAPFLHRNRKLRA